VGTQPARTSFTAGAPGRWLIYSVNPNNNIAGGLTGEAQWSTTYLGGPPARLHRQRLPVLQRGPGPAAARVQLRRHQQQPEPLRRRPFGNHGGSIFEDGGGLADAEDNAPPRPATSSNWDLGTMRDAVASDGTDSSDRKPRRKRRSASDTLSFATDVGRSRLCCCPVPRRALAPRGVDGQSRDGARR